jgi:hypothetical protein
MQQWKGTTMDLRSTGLLGPSNEPNCGVTAVAVITGKPFYEVMETMRKLLGHTRGWKGRTYWGCRKLALTHYGVPFTVDFLATYKRGERLPLLSSYLKRLAPGVTYMVDVTGHSITVRDGMFADQCGPDWRPLQGHRLLRKRVHLIVRIEKGEAA